MADLAQIVATFGQVLHVDGLRAAPDGRATLNQAVIVVAPNKARDVYGLVRDMHLPSRAQVHPYQLDHTKAFR